MFLMTASFKRKFCQNLAANNRACQSDRARQVRQTRLSTSIFFTSAIALAGFSPLGQACAQFMIVRQM
jgi:hypothetical protein